MLSQHYPDMAEVCVLTSIMIHTSRIVKSKFVVKN